MSYQTHEEISAWCASLVLMFRNDNLYNVLKNYGPDVDCDYGYSKNSSSAYHK